MKYYCDIQEAEQFGRLVWATGIQHQADAHEEIVFVSDGAVWIWNLVQNISERCTDRGLVPCQRISHAHRRSRIWRQYPQAHEWLTQARTELGKAAFRTLSNLVAVC